MPISRPKALRLETLWNPPADGKEFSYVLRLKNLGTEPLSNFSLCVSGPGRVDPAGRESAGQLQLLRELTAAHPEVGLE